MNSSAVLVSGAAFGRHAPEYLKKDLSPVFGAASMARGIVLIVKADPFAVMVIAMLLIVILREVINLERATDSGGSAPWALLF